MMEEVIEVAFFFILIIISVNICYRHMDTYCCCCSIVAAVAAMAMARRGSDRVPASVAVQGVYSVLPTERHQYTADVCNDLVYSGI